MDKFAGTELLITAKSAKVWYVIERPITEDIIPQKDIKRLFTTTSKPLAVAFAEGRVSVSGQPIRAF
jgi:hypothetical protein